MLIGRENMQITNVCLFSACFQYEDQFKDEYYTGGRSGYSKKYGYDKYGECGKHQQAKVFALAGQRVATATCNSTQ